ncbi:helix-turn-helix domain-containing protein [Modestobacter altitudinis]|uniref:helix-turn-helix domain-containing protein n=1 Tax=Modestobacter altitudinis TaxID=2213158 RepID=UPI001486B51B|nr:helix-turn-helix transcriptional regulator [Modestobacter altitudinis]
MDEQTAARRRLGALVRRIRRTADLSQRELARALGVSAGAVAQAESGARDLPATVLGRAAELAGLRFALLDASGGEVPAMDDAAVRDRGGRLFPAHLDPRHGDVAWWHGPERYSRERPEYTYDRDRRERDELRTAVGVPPDHHVPRPGDSLEERARARAEAAAAAWAARQRLAFAHHLLRQRERLELGLPLFPDPTCSCPPACDDLLFADGPQSPRQRAVPHVEDCPCRCDIA